MKIMNRRAVLRGVGGAAIALPMLEIMMPPRPARAEGGITKIGKNGRPKRFLMVEHFNGHGVRWFANTMGPDGLQLGPVMAPMEKHGHTKDLILIDGISNLVSQWADQAESGHDAQRTITTAVPNKNKAPGGISIDQAIAQEIAGDTKFKSGIQLAMNGPGTRGDYLSVSPTAPIEAITDPQKSFARLFADFQTDPLVFERAKMQRASILDNVRTNYEQFVMKVGRVDKVKIQTHLDALRELEVRLQKMPTATSGVCMKPKMAAEAGAGKNVAKGHAFMDLTAMAFACDLTRTATVAWNDGTGSAPQFPHDVSHAPEDSPAWNAASTVLVEYMAGFIDRLKAIEDGPAGTVWDNTVFFWTTEVGTGNHTNCRNTWLVAGSGGGYLKTNQLIKLPWKFAVEGNNKTEKWAIGHGDLFVTFLNAMGVPATTFGMPEFFKGPIRQMVA